MFDKPIEFSYVPDDFTSPVYATEDEAADKDPHVNHPNRKIDDNDDNTFNKVLPDSKAKGLIYSVEAAIRHINLKMQSARLDHGRPKRCWEVYVGAGRTSANLRAMGADVRTFGLHNEWDMTDLAKQTAFLKLTDEEEPDEILMSPMCGPWSAIQELNALTDDGKAKLTTLRA